MSGASLFRTNNLLKKGNEIKVDWPSFKTNDGWDETRKEGRNGKSQTATRL